MFNEKLCSILYLKALFLLITACLFSASSFAAKHANIIIVHSYHQGDAWSDALQSGIENSLSDTNVQLSIEYLDSRREQSSQHVQHIADLLEYKLSHNRYDAIIATDTVALSLVNQLTSNYLNDTPVIYTDINPQKKRIANNIKHLSIIESTPDVLKGMQLAINLHPSAKKIYAVLDNSLIGERLAKGLNQVREELPVELEILQKYSYEALKAKISALGQDGILYYLYFGTDRNGEYHQAQRFAQELSKISLLPIYTSWDFNIVPGVTGGYVVDTYHQGQLVAAQVKKALAGLPMQRTAESPSAAMLYQFDYAELKSWGIAQSALPMHSKILNKPSELIEVNSYLLHISLIFAFLLLIFIYYHLSHLMRSQRDLRVSQVRFNTLFNQATQFSGLLRVDGSIELVNQATLMALNINSEQIQNLAFTQLYFWEFSSLSKKEIYAYVQQAINGQRVSFSFELHPNNKPSRYIECSLKPILNRSGQTEILVEAQDLSDIKQAEKAARESENQLRLVYEENPSLLLTLELDGTISTLNRAAFRLLGYKASDLLGMPITSLYVDLNQKSFLPGYLNKALTMRSQVNSREVCYLAESGKHLWFKETIRKLPGKKQFLLVGEDISKNRELAQKLIFQASHDFLTGLYNRNYFEEQLDVFIDQALNNDARHALFYLDLDQFKVINDTFGHDAGDMAITQVSELFKQIVPSCALLARLGGDEFGLLVPNYSRTQAISLADKVLKAINDFYFQWQDNILTVGCSMGLVLVDKNSGLRPQVMSAVDSACYAAKAEGSNRLHLYKPDDIELQKRKVEMEWVSRIQAAIRENRFCLYAQPICQAQPDKDYLHYEVLARLIDEQGELVSPALIISSIEKYNLANQLDKFLVEKTLNWLQNNPHHVMALDVCSINLSGQSVGDIHFINYLVNLLAESSLPMSKLCFEITETTAIANFSQASQLISQLHLLGCKVALDDFGSGLSSFGYLKKLDVDYLKIDGIFVKDIANDKRDYAIVSSINELSKILGKKTIAEYVEDEKSLFLLREIGVDYVQGYHLSRPVPIDLIALDSSQQEPEAPQLKLLEEA